MNQQDVLKLKEIIAQSLDVDVSTIGNEFNLIDAGFDSISFIKMIILIENLFSIEFDDDDLSIFTLSTLSILTEYIEQKLKTAAVV